jgi:Contractile injection system tube protein/LysM domain
MSDMLSSLGGLISSAVSGAAAGAGPAAGPAAANGAGPTHASLDATGYQHAKLQFEDGTEIECWFNPTQYSITKSNTWNVKPGVKKGPPKAQFGGGQPKELSLDLLFDASDSSKDVRSEVVDKLFEMMDASDKFASGQSKKSARPPTVTFTWGAQVLKAVAKSLSVQYTLFRPDGKPLRAAVKLSLMEVPEGGLQGQNPTTRGEVLESRIVRDGDTLQSFAYAAYGDATEWRVIAEANGIDDPLALHRGRSLVIPRLVR